MNFLLIIQKEFSMFSPFIKGIGFFSLYFTIQNSLFADVQTVVSKRTWFSMTGQCDGQFSCQVVMGFSADKKGGYFVVKIKKSTFQFQMIQAIPRFLIADSSDHRYGLTFTLQDSDPKKITFAPVAIGEGPECRRSAFGSTLSSGEPFNPSLSEIILNKNKEGYVLSVNPFMFPIKTMTADNKFLLKMIEKNLISKDMRCD